MPPEPDTAERWRIRVEGIVQGVGFRPFVATLADEVGLAGEVGNDSDGVFISVAGDPSQLRRFRDLLTDRAPALARVDQVRVERTEKLGTASIASRRFRIVASRSAVGGEALVTPDAAMCVDCRSELYDPLDRRFGYPFVNCTNCGPRYTIVTGVPYDRASTTMAGFAMCADCRAEYDNPHDRRYHAQPVCCPRCGPRLSLVNPAGATIRDDPVTAAATLLRDGNILAVKGLGGYHLAVVADDEVAVRRLRERKHREQRPFALMALDLVDVGALVEVSEDEARLLAGPAAPIVLLRRRPTAAVAESVAPGRDELGVMLAYTPLHHLLLTAVGRPIVLTSGNLSDEPIAFRDQDAAQRLAGITDAFLTHDRPIRTRVDDSVLRVVGHRAAPIRRSRGYAPDPVRLPWSFPRPVLAVGPELKNTICLARGHQAVVSQHIGDLENYETLSSFTDAIEALQVLFGITPEVVVHDLHPEYLSTKFALEQESVGLIGVQHHHAHVASCLADNGFAGPVIGIAFDGLGMGDDGVLWGGEFLLADLVGYRRVGHLRPVSLPGGSAAVRQPWRMAAAYLESCFAGDLPESLPVMARHGTAWPQVLAASRAGLNSPLTSSMGRLFDAVAAILDVRDEVSYEGQAAIELEQLAAEDESDWYDGCGAGVEGEIDVSAMVRAVVADRLAGVTGEVVAARFHNSVVRLVVDTCRRVREQEDVATVALSGGVFQNVRLLRGCVQQLTAAGFQVLTHQRIPTNDGGISLGQAVVAGARDRAGV